MLPHRLLRTLLATHAPAFLGWIRAVRGHWRHGRQHGELQRRIAEALYPDGEIRVLAGPFAGMRHLDVVAHGCIAPHWIGSAECELHDDIEVLIARAPELVVNVGAAEGYDAVGFALRPPRARVVVSKVDPFARRALRHIARTNGVADRIDIRGWCTPRRLADVLRDRRHALVWCDIEGGEYGLLDPARVPELARTDIVVEVHPSDGLGIEDGIALLRSRFWRTHDVAVRPTRPRRVEDWRPLTGGRLDDALLAEALAERRRWPQAWLVLRARERPGGA